MTEPFLRRGNTLVNHPRQGTHSRPDNSKVHLGLNPLQEALLFSESCVSISLSESYLKLGSVYSGRAKLREFLKLHCLAVYGSPLQNNLTLAFFPSPSPAMTP